MGTRIVSATPARRFALKATTAIRTREAYAHEVVSTLLDRSNLSAEDSSFATRLVYGVTQSSGTLDEVLDRYISRPGSLDPVVRDALRISAYELIFLEKPAHVAVDQGVELVRSVAGRAAGLANAVLRKIAKAASEFPWGDAATDVEALARATAHPGWIAQRLVDDLGSEAAAAMMFADVEPAPLYVATDIHRAGDDEVFAALDSDGALPVSLGVPGCFRCESASAAVGGSTIASGRAIVADAAAQLVAWLARPASSDPYLEVGAGRGTKTILLHGNAVRDGLVPSIHALDSHGFKADILHRRLTESRIGDVVIHVGDATDLDSIDSLPNSFTAALIDAPCSGSGTLRRHPEKRWRLTSQDVEEMAVLGGSILESIAGRIAVGGTIVYSTCSVFTEENEDVVNSFLSGSVGASFEIDPITEVLPEPFSEAMIVDGYFRSTPALGGPDGHFAARLRRIR